ncbi:hypothetical protein OS190_19680 [Sulfitobacter sp. F26204]|uniref:hypothetical protein n=1 Tax=Sulfitobacter sp. F26204 TaxID=2996014 RepID=UPI00225DE462|nr:hypothetical protein [Sulfitobacter sp. F26204]MCX7561787.1 hypothetical protein [Sulfitobacter sp. F26204]
MTYALATFLVAAIGGLVLAASVLRGQLAPWALSLIHAALGALGLILLAGSILNGETSWPPLVAFALLAIAALGGFYLANLHLRKIVAPAPAVVVHASAAVGGVALLLLSALGLL